MRIFLSINEVLLHIEIRIGKIEIGKIIYKHITYAYTSPVTAAIYLFFYEEAMLSQNFILTFQRNGYKCGCPNFSPLMF